MKLIYRLLWRILVRSYKRPKPYIMEIKGLGDVKHLNVIDGDLVIIVDGAEKL